MPLPHPTPVRCDAAQAAELIERHDVWVLDLDGTVWRGAELIKGAKEALELLRSLGKRIVYFTNNSMRSRQAYVDKLVALGLPANLVSASKSTHVHTACRQSAARVCSGAAAAACGCAVASLDPALLHWYATPLSAPMLCAATAPG